MSGCSLAGTCFPFHTTVKQSEGTSNHTEFPELTEIQRHTLETIHLQGKQNERDGSLSFRYSWVWRKAWLSVSLWMPENDTPRSASAALGSGWKFSGLDNKLHWFLVSLLIGSIPFADETEHRRRIHSFVKPKMGGIKHQKAGQNSCMVNLF